MTDVTVTKPSPKAGITLFQHELEQRKGALSQILPSQVSVDRFIRTTLTAVLLSPDLLNADRKSLIVSCMRAAQDGLLCDGRESALVTFNTKDGNGGWTKKVQYMPMVTGVLKKLRNTGEISSIAAHVVYEKDRFIFTMGDDEKIVHEPYLEGEPGEIKFVYAIAKLKDGSIQREVMSRTQIEKVRAVSKSKDSGPWANFYDEMCRKTVLRRIAKYLPSSAEIDRVIHRDEEESEIINVTHDDSFYLADQTNDVWPDNETNELKSGNESVKLGNESVKELIKGKIVSADQSKTEIHTNSKIIDHNAVAQA